MDTSRTDRGQQPMRLLDLTLPHPAENLALDEALLLAAEEGIAGEVLRFWELAAPAVIVGAGGSVSIDVNVNACERDGVPIVRRASGGGTVLLGPGCLCFSLVLSYLRAVGLDQIALSNQYVLGRIRAALVSVAPNAAIEGTSDLALSQKEPLKVSGNAQQRKRQFFLHHGTLLCGLDLSLVHRYLKAPEKEPLYRRGRSHAEFVANLAASSAALKGLLINEWRPEGEYTSLPWDILQGLMAEKYSREEWHRRR